MLSILEDRRLQLFTRSTGKVTRLYLKTNTGLVKHPVSLLTKIPNSKKRSGVSDKYIRKVARRIQSIHHSIFKQYFAARHFGSKITSFLRSSTASGNFRRAAAILSRHGDETAASGDFATFGEAVFCMKLPQPLSGEGNPMMFGTTH